MVLSNRFFCRMRIKRFWLGTLTKCTKFLLEIKGIFKLLSTDKPSDNPPLGVLEALYYQN